MGRGIASFRTQALNASDQAVDPLPKQVCLNRQTVVALNDFGNPSLYPFFQELELLEGLGIRCEGFETGLQIGFGRIGLAEHLLKRLERLLDFIGVHFLIGFLQRF